MLSHLKNKTLAGSYLVGFFLMFSFVGVYNYVGFLLAGPPYLLSTKALGLIFLTYLAGTISSTLSGAISNRLGNPFTIGASVIISILGLLLTFNSNIFLFISGLTLFCFGFFAGHSAASSWVSINARGARCGASGLYLIGYYLGGGLGGTMLGPLWVKWQWSGVVLGTTFCLVLAVVLAVYLSRLTRVKTDGVERGVSG